MVKIRLDLILLFLLFSLPLIQSATVTWNVAEGDWSNDINWDTNVRHSREGRMESFIEFDQFGRELVFVFRAFLPCAQ